MNWITRENAKVDRVACPWLIRKFIDSEAQFHFAPADEVMERAWERWAIPFDVPDVQFGHRGGRCSFESLVLQFGLTGSHGLRRLAQIVHAADIPNDAEWPPEGRGLRAIAEGFALLHGRDDQRKIALQTPLYDALYAWCGAQAEPEEKAR